MLFGTVVYNIWTKRVGDLDYESINFCSKVRYTIVTAAAQLRKGAGAAAGRTLKIEYGCERYVEMLRIINEAWKGNVDSNPAFEEPSMILLEQIFTIDKSRIERFMGYASKAEMLRIDMALLVSLALNVLSGNRSE